VVAVLEVSSPNSQQERLWAPWRIGYVSGDDAEAAAHDPLPDPAVLLAGAEPSCFLCRAAAEPADAASDRVNHVVQRRQSTVVVLNRYPYNNGHLLIAPRRHLGDFQEVPADVHAEITHSIGALLAVVGRIFRVDGFNVGLNLGRVAGAGLPGHLHWHVVPRWQGDHNFMATTAGTRVIPQSLDAAWQVLWDAVGGAE
jgi:ATP adenylyltransferase